MKRSASLAVALLVALPGLCLGDDERDAVRGIATALGAPPAAADAGHGFRHHVREAIALNEARRERYAERSGGASRCVTRRLLLGERVTLPVAWLYDRRARRFNRAGIGIVRDDFVAMSGVAPADAPPRYRGQATAAQADEVRALVGDFKGHLRALLARDDLRGAAALTATAIGAVQARERAWGCHFAMTVHVLEQVGYAAVRGVGYAERSDGETLELSRSFLRLLALPLKMAVGLDVRAQACHAQGVGILVNDLPPIPFHEAWAALRARQQHDETGTSGGAGRR